MFLSAELEDVLSKTYQLIVPGHHMLPSTRDRPSKLFILPGTYAELD